MSKRTTDPSQVIPFQEKFGYALGDFASNLFWMPFILFGTIFYTDVFGISAMSVGVMLLVTRIWDTVIDPLMGAIADRTVPRKGLGRYRPYLYWFALPFGFISASAFFTPNVGSGGKLVYAWVTYTAFGIIYTVINIPYSTLMSVMSKEPGERQSVSFFRMVGAQSAGLIVSTGLMYFIAKAGGGNQQRGWFLVMGAFAALAVVCFLATGKMTRERVEPELKPAGEAKKDLASIVSCWPWWVLFFVSFFTIAAFTLRYGVAAYYFKYYADQKAIAEWSLYEGGAISAFFTLDKIAALISVVAFGAFAKKIEKKKMYVILIVTSGLLSLGFNYVPNTNVTAIILIQAAFSFLTAPTGAILFAMYTDIAAHIRNESGTISNGLVMSAGSFSQKFGWAIGGSITGILLGAAGYVPDQAQTETVKHIMSFMMSWAPMIACTIAAGFMLLYPLNDQRMREITEELDAKGFRDPVPAE
jgi:GPH family glycoside/pentoside/hexuronide:cation symporter